LTAPPWLWPRAAYVHIPFCAHHCGYCDFAVAVGQNARVDAYLDALEAEVALLGEPRPVRTLFVGGGTPSHLSPPDLRRLLGMLARWLLLEAGGEYTFEANPDSLTAEKIALMAEAGVNRVSLGAQSFDAASLAVLERTHRPDEVARAVERLRPAIESVSLDLIFGVPGQTPGRWRADMERALELSPDHVSTYGLTYEKGTRLWKQRRSGRLMSLGEEDELALYELAIDTLEAAGFEHYEVSNFARPGRRSRHNQVYWANHAYWGFGMGAARYIGGRREMNTRSLDEYISRLLYGRPATQSSEELPPLERARETMAVQLRRMEGINRASFAEQTGHDLDAVAGPHLPALVEQGLLLDDGASVRLTRLGKAVADGVIERLL
jgi:oxygen-independent coproporphyrinogen-3 oxidase